MRTQLLSIHQPSPTIYNKSKSRKKKGRLTNPPHAAPKIKLPNRGCLDIKKNTTSSSHKNDTIKPIFVNILSPFCHIMDFVNIKNV